MKKKNRFAKYKVKRKSEKKLAKMMFTVLVEYEILAREKFLLITRVGCVTLRIAQRFRRFVRIAFQVAFNVQWPHNEETRKKAAHKLMEAFLPNLSVCCRLRTKTFDVRRHIWIISGVCKSYYSAEAFGSRHKSPFLF